MTSDEDMTPEEFDRLGAEGEVADVDLTNATLVFDFINGRFSVRRRVTFSGARVATFRWLPPKP